MKPELFWITSIDQIRLAIIPHPRAGDWLSDEIGGWRSAGIKVVLSLLEPHEVRELGLHDEQDLCWEEGIEFISFPIPDRGVPSSIRSIESLLDKLVDKLRHGVNVGIQSRSGIGRAGVVSACLMARMGVPFDELFPTLARVRGVPVPDTDRQVEWVREFAATAKGPRDRSLPAES